MLSVMVHKHSSHCTRGLTPEQRLDHYLPSKPPGACWIFTGTLNYAGYGVLHANLDGAGSRQWRAHRLAYELWVGPIPKDLTIDHVRGRGCINRSCCNPSHLEPVTSGVNCLRGDSPQAVAARKALCSRGHVFDVKRIVGGREYRDCSQCRLIRSRKNGGYKGVGSGRHNSARGADGRFEAVRG